jgi:subtilisin family serine protease
MATAQPPAPFRAFDRSRDYVPGELLVGFRPGAAPDIAAVYQLFGLEERERLDAGAAALRHVRFSLSPGVSVAEQTAQVITRLAGHPLVRFVEPNYIFHTSRVPSDPRFAELYGLHNTDPGERDADIDAPEAWDVTTGDSNVIVFVIDTGIDYTHPDLVDNLWTNAAEAGGMPGIDDDNNGYIDDVHGINAITGSGDPMENHGHGTHVAGTIGAQGNNGVGVVGVAWDIKIGACKFLDQYGNGSLTDAIECFRYANLMKANGYDIKATNNSWGGGGYSQALRDAMAGLDQPTIEPILHACAAGNSHSDNDVTLNYPSSYDLPNIVAVAATERQDFYAAFSSYGATTVDLAAPGVDILSTVPATGASCCSDPTGYKLLSGTSMATPFVTGAAALVWSKAGNSALSAVDVKSRLLGSVDYIGDLGTNASMPTVTNGRLNANYALEVGSDVVAPQAVSSLSITAQSLTSMTLSWYAPGDDGLSGTAASYDVRFSTSEIDAGNWAAATRALGEPLPQVAGSVQTFTVSGLQAGTTYYFGLKTRDNVGNESGLSNVPFDATVAGTTVLADDASTAGAWVAAGSPSPSLWHRSQRRSTSPAYSWWYGNETSGTYNTGGANWGTLTTTVDLTGYAEAGLRFAEWSQVEPTSTFDRTRVQASTDGANWITIFESHGTAGQWAQRWADLTAYAGQSAQLRFYFDTFDHILNDYEGWFVDDIRVVGLAPAGTGVVAAFSGSPTIGFAPLTVQFTDESTTSDGSIVSRGWNLGAGTSSAQNPSQIYPEPGTYTVSLTVTDSTGAQASLAKTGYITVKRTAKADSIGYAWGGNRGRDLSVNIRVLNWANVPIAGASVYANLYRGMTLVKSFVVTSNLGDGIATYKLKNAGSGCYTTMITNLTSSNHEWNGLTPVNGSCP